MTRHFGGALFSFCVGVIIHMRSGDEPWLLLATLGCPLHVLCSPKKLDLATELDLPGRRAFAFFVTVGPSFPCDQPF